jgi:hypothetical protein
MAKISTYPQPTPPQLGDYLLGTDISDLLMTKNYVISDILALAPSNAYKAYVVFFNQERGEAPSITPLYNSIGSISWARTSAGVFTGTLTGAFPVSKTFFPNKQFCKVYDSEGGTRNINMTASGGNSVIIEQNDGIDSIDGLSLHLEIRVYI